jgi:hypothetical protein
MYVLRSDDRLLLTAASARKEIKKSAMAFSRGAAVMSGQAGPVCAAAASSRISFVIAAAV